MLTLGTAADHVAVYLLLLALAALALFLFWREYRDQTLLLWMAGLVAAALFLRLLCLDHVSHDYENFLARWVDLYRHGGGFKAFSRHIGDYNAPYLYFLAAISYTRFPDMYAIKLFSSLFDVLLAWGCLRLTRVLRVTGKQARRGNKRDILPAAAFALALLLPTVILNGSFWGQCDSLYAALAVHAAVLTLEGKNIPSVALMAVAFSFKLQTVFLLPLWGVLWLAGRVKFRELWVFPGVYALTILPALLLGKPLRDILGVYWGQVTEFSKLTLNAPSVYQFIPYDAKPDKALFSALGIAAAFALVCALLLCGWALQGRLDDRTVLLTAAVLVIGVPFLLPRMHERYFFLADVFTLCWACVDHKKGLSVCILAAGSSLLSYSVYLRLKYNMVISAWGFRFVMALEASMMLSALILAAREMMRTLREKQKLA